jgi:VIT1/CCC1 family predicted Fe2+/Mn2+ transporter
MSTSLSRTWRKSLLPAVMGIADGILTSLTLAAGLLTDQGQKVTFGLAFRVAAAALTSGAFVYFVAGYAGLRHELVRAEHELSLLSHGRLAATNLGRAVLRDAAVATAISSGAAFAGALMPLLVAALVPQYRWASILTALVALGLLGRGLAGALYGSTLRWSLSLILGGAALTFLGTQLKLL